MSRGRREWRNSAPVVLMLASGFAALGYQIVWTEQCALFIGHESAAVLAVIAAFLGGLATGGLALGPRIERSERPLAWYAGCELAIGVWGLMVVFGAARFNGWAAALTGVEPSPAWEWCVAYGSTFVLFLPATAAMGATLPALKRVSASVGREEGSLAALYAGNTFGGVLGVLGCAFVLIPTLGLAKSALVCVALNGLCGVTALALLPKRSAAKASAPPRSDARANGVLARLALTGFLGIGYEVVVVRVLAQVTEDTVYTFALLLAVYLVGSAAGAAGYRRWLEQRPLRGVWGDRLFAALAIACLVGTAALYGAELFRSWVLDAFGGSVAAALAAEAFLAVVAFGPPTFVMGALFCHLGRAAGAAGIGFGRALGVNTLAGAAAPTLFGVLAVPALGAKVTLLALALGYLGAVRRSAWTRKLVWLPAAATLGLGLLAPPLVFIDIPSGGHVVRYEDGVMAAVSVVEDAEGVARLRINNRQQEGSSASRYVDARQAWLPLLLHATPRRALFLGLGTGVTATSAADDPTLEVDAVELLPEVIRASSEFRARTEDHGGGRRLHLVASDARRYVRQSRHRYDVIVADNFHPARSGSGSLYTVEHFSAVRARLAPGGVFCQWLPLHQLDLGTMRSIVRSFVAAFPRGFAVLASNSLETPVIGLVARSDAGRFELDALEHRLSHLALPELPRGLGLDDELAVLGSFVAGPEALLRFAGNAPPNTDDHPVVAYGAPHVTYAPSSSPRDRLIALLHALTLEPGELLVPTSDPSWPRRLGAYWLARNRFVELGRDVRPSPLVEDMLARVRDPLLDLLRISPDFRPAYDPLLSMARALAHSNVAGAHALLTELSRIQPTRTEASQMLSLLEGDAAGAKTSAR